jgi:dTDP-4-dehydrorhamnose 3,5-epimerase
VKIETTSLPGVLLIKPTLFGDSRGYFQESWNQKRYAELGFEHQFVQDNLSLSRKGILRGLHLQNPNPQGKLVYVLRGTVFDVAVDVRAGSPNFGQWFGTVLSEENHHQLFVPEGFAHGFCVTSDEALFAYKCTDFYSPASELSIAWNDPDLAIPWPLENPILSGKDQEGLNLKDLSLDQLVPWKP